MSHDPNANPMTSPIKTPEQLHNACAAVMDALASPSEGTAPESGETKGVAAGATGSGTTEKKVTIGELEALLASDEKLDIEIQPDGSIRAVPAGTANNAKPLVLKLSDIGPTNY